MPRGADALAGPRWEACGAGHTRGRAAQCRPMKAGWSGPGRPGPLGSMTWFSKAVKTLGKAPSKEWPSLGLRSGRSPGQLSVIIKLRKGCLSRRQSHPSPASFLLRDPRRDTHPAPHAHRGQTERPRASSQLAGFLPAGSPCPVSHPHTRDTGGDSCSAPCSGRQGAVPV